MIRFPEVCRPLLAGLNSLAEKRYLVFPVVLPTILEVLGVAMSLDPTALASMGLNGRRWMIADFDWASVAGQMAAAYRWLLDGGAPPDCVRVE